MKQSKSSCVSGRAAPGLIRPDLARTGPVRAGRSDTRVTMRILPLSLLLGLVVSQSTRQEPPPGRLTHCQQIILTSSQGRDVVAVITMGGGVVLRSSPVVWERGTVTDHWTAVLMTDTRAAGETSCAGVTTAESLELTSMRRTTAVTDQRISLSGRSRSSCRALP